MLTHIPQSYRKRPVRNKRHFSGDIEDSADYAKLYDMAALSFIK